MEEVTVKEIPTGDDGDEEIQKRQMRYDARIQGRRHTCRKCKGEVTVFQTGTRLRGVKLYREDCPRCGKGPIVYPI